MTKELLIQLLDKQINLQREYNFKSSHSKLIFLFKNKIFFRYLRHRFSKSFPFISDEEKIYLFCKKIILAPLTDTEIFNLFLFGVLTSTEHSLTKFLINELKEGDIFYDVGANYGFYTALAQTIIKNGEIHAFEPNNQVYRYLQKLASKNTFIRNFGLSDTERETPLYTTNKGSGKSTIVPDVLTIDKKVEKSRVVSLTTLKKYISENKKPTIVKIDVEGAELKVIGGGKEFLKDFTGIIIIEVWGGEKGVKHSFGAVKLLRELGYTSYGITSEGKLYRTEIDPLKINSDHENFVFKKS